MRSTFSLTLILFFFFGLSAQEINIIPQPADIKKGTGFLTIKQPIGFIINADPEIGDGGIGFFKQYLKEKYHIGKFVEGNTHSYGLPTEIFIDYEEDYLPKEGYEITVSKKNIAIKGRETGLFYAFQTLIQLLPPTGSKEIKIPICTIKDYPRFAYRGMHLDVGRHFFPVSFIKKYIDYLAFHKLNIFHWHLTEDQGWRIEIKKYPRLTSVGGYRNGTIIGRYPGTGNDNIHYGGFYTQAEIKEVVKYAKERYIDVIPEIEMPGHGSAAIAAYEWLSCFPAQPTAIPPNMISKTSVEQQAKGRIKLVQETWGVFDDVFCAGNDSTFLFLQNVIDEVITLFPSRYFHIGGDECPKTHWKKCPRCQLRMKEHNLKDEHELQSYFVQRIEKYLNSKGKTLIGWDEILEGGLAPKAVVMSWRGEEGGIAAAKQKHEVIMTPGNPVYFDHTQSLNEDSVTIGGYNPIENVFAYEPVPKELSAEEGKYVLGAQANVWTEYMKNTRKVEYMIFPRMAALSEVLWTSGKIKRWDDFAKRLRSQFEKYKLWKVNYSNAFFDLKTSVLPSKGNKGILWGVTSRRKAKITIGNPGSKNAFHVIDYTDSTILAIILGRGKYVAEQKGKDFINQVQQTFHFNKATGKKISLAVQASRNYPGDGAFTLVNGVQNEKGLARSREFLGWSGDDLEAVIDLGSSQSINSAIIHSLSSGGSWIYPPKSAEIFISADGQLFTSAAKSENFETTMGSNGIIKLSFTPVAARYIKVVVKNLGTIPEGRPGAGNKPWLFVDEIEVN